MVQLVPIQSFSRSWKKSNYYLFNQFKKTHYISLTFTDLPHNLADKGQMPYFTKGLTFLLQKNPDSRVHDNLKTLRDLSDYVKWIIPVTKLVLDFDYQLFLNLDGISWSITNSFLGDLHLTYCCLALFHKVYYRTLYFDLSCQNTSLTFMKTMITRNSS